MNEDACFIWLDKYVKPFIEARGGGEHAGKSSLHQDPAKAHITKKVKEKCEKLNIIVIFIPASLTYKYQFVDLYFAATFKKFYSNAWTAWFVGQLQKAYENKEGAYRPKSLNYIKPSMSLCIIWANQAYEKMKLKKPMFKRKAKDVYMRGEDVEMAALMPDHYAGKFKSSYEPDAWAK